MLSNQQVTNEKPQVKAGTKTQGNARNNSDGNSTMLKDRKSRFEKGMGLYKSGRVSIGSNGLFKVSGYYEADTEKMRCTCPDYKTRKETCKHLFAAILFVKNRGKQTIEGLEEAKGNGNGHTNPELREPSEKPKVARSRDFDRQSTITRLAVLNTSVEILRTQDRPVSFDDVVTLASRLEAWALGN